MQQQWAVEFDRWHGDAAYKEDCIVKNLLQATPPGHLRFGATFFLVGILKQTEWHYAAEANLKLKSISISDLRL